MVAPETNANQCNATSDGLLHHPYLSTLNLVVNEEFRFLACQECGIALLQEDVVLHLMQQHPALQIDHIKFMGAVTNMTIVDDFPEIIEGPRTKVHGLSIHDAFTCEHCLKIYSTENSIRSHHHKQHKDIPKPRSWRSCKAQRIHAQSTTIRGARHLSWETYVKDTISEARQSTESLVSSLLEELEEEFNIPTAKSDERLATPWLMTTRWHEYIAEENLSVESLCNMTALPKDDDNILPGLRSAVNSYFQEALALLSITDELVLKRLNSPSPLQQ